MASVSTWGGKKFNRADLRKSADTWWTAAIPYECIPEDFPASAPEVNHEVVMLKE